MSNDDGDELLDDDVHHAKEDVGLDSNISVIDSPGDGCLDYINRHRSTIIMSPCLLGRIGFRFKGSAQKDICKIFQIHDDFCAVPQFISNDILSTLKQPENILLDGFDTPFDVFGDAKGCAEIDGCCVGTKRRRKFKTILDKFNAILNFILKDQSNEHSSNHILKEKRPIVQELVSNLEYIEDVLFLGGGVKNMQSRIANILNDEELDEVILWKGILCTGPNPLRLYFPAIDYRISLEIGDLMIYKAFDWAENDRNELELKPKGEFCYKRKSRGPESSMILHL